MEKFMDQFDHVILLTVPDEVIVLRLLKRTGAAYGQSEAEIAPALQLKHEIEPLLGSLQKGNLQKSLPMPSLL
ncbi:hypothetical protein KTO58_10195 [Chitinophaga pendula]|uniref:hypothetical protein n=1 Tax=Chitinophaga TaxID=79328 RepID=UPI0012FE0A22|nr:MULTISPECIES: hypothetical protein [Chitinophaga]UCJ09533.1 hypothetical protein KTO58_10195 [Chitinophaga pendula]